MAHEIQHEIINENVISCILQKDDLIEIIKMCQVIAILTWYMIGGNNDIYQLDQITIDNLIGYDICYRPVQDGGVCKARKVLEVDKFLLSSFWEWGTHTHTQFYF